MEQLKQGLSPTHGDEFSEAEYAAEPEKLVAHAAVTGRAIVVGPTGRPRVIITIPTTDLPMLDLDY